jgi:hypothetical protein
MQALFNHDRSRLNDWRRLRPNSSLQTPAPNSHLAAATGHYFAAIPTTGLSCIAGWRPLTISLFGGQPLIVTIRHAEETGVDPAPKEQPPRKLSGKRTAWGRHLWRAAAPMPLTEGRKQATIQGRRNLSGR